MALHVFFDTSALLKRYAPEPGSHIVNELFNHVPIEQITCSTLSIVELYSVLVRKRNDGRITQSAYRQTYAEFFTEIADNEAFETSPVSDTLILSAADLVEKHNINASDAIILRAALDLQQLLYESGDTLLFCAADKRLIRAAQAEGITTLDPEEGAVEYLRELFK